MDERLSRRIVGHSIPEYMIEILIQDYAGTFLRMVVSRNGSVYDLSYEQNGYRRAPTFPGKVPPAGAPVRYK